jgi:hypothetical protein|tara:strand:- start:4251 stop:4463 length:213 start_codon:yes stop_codon:yes gene_type:complete
MKQEEYILAFFKDEGKPQSPSMVYDSLPEHWPITSVRRAITNLTTAGELVKTNSTVTGMYGKPEHLWSLK